MKTPRLVIWDFVQRYLDFNQRTLCLTKFKSEVESSRTHFEVLGLEAQVLGFEAYKSSKMSCPRLEDCIIFWLVEKENNRTKNNQKF